MIELKNLQSDDIALKAKLETCWQMVLARKEVGFTRLPEMAEDWQALEQRLRDCRPAKRTLVIGIGGSSLGTQVIFEAFRASRQSHMTFLESPDPDVWSLHRAFREPEWRDKHVVIVSKSGGTLETLAWVERLNASEPAWLKNSQVTVVCSPGSGPLQTWASKEKLPTLNIPENVGGRFSVLTAAGMFPAGLMGLNLKEFREGAAWALKHPEMATDLSLEIVKSWARGEWISQMWTYSEGMKVLGEWWQQLWSESLGKKMDRNGRPAPRVSSPMACRGPRDQHSQVQQLVEVPGDKFVFVNRVRAVENSDDLFTPSLFPSMPFHGKKISLGRILSAEAEAFERSLKEARVPFCTLAIENISERSLASYFMLWQMVIAQLGEYLGIDAFDQPGVESGKKHASQILEA